MLAQNQSILSIIVPEDKFTVAIPIPAKNPLIPSFE